MLSSNGKEGRAATLHTLLHLDLSNDTTSTILTTLNKLPRSSTATSAWSPLIWQLQFLLATIHVRCITPEPLKTTAPPPLVLKVHSNHLTLVTGFEGCSSKCDSRQSDHPSAKLDESRERSSNLHDHGAMQKPMISATTHLKHDCFLRHIASLWTTFSITYLAHAASTSSRPFLARLKRHSASYLFLPFRECSSRHASSALTTIRG